MGLETGTYINSLNPLNPTYNDPRSEGDDHIRLVKATLQNTFPNVTGAVAPTHVELNHVAGVTSGIQAQINGVVQSKLEAAVQKDTPVDADRIPLLDSAASLALKYFSWANLVAKFVGLRNTWTKGQVGAVVALTSGASVALDLSLSNNFSLTLGVNATLSNPTNAVAGQSGVIAVTQDATGSRTLAYGANYKFAGGTVPVLTTAANAVDYLTYYVESTTRIFVSLVKDVK